jgi:hypothetical protein
MFFQNPIGEEFRSGSWPIDQQTNFIIPANLNNIAELVSGNAEPYDFSVNNIFTINIAYDPNRIGYTAIPVNIAGAIPAATTAVEVVTKLNANPLFADNFTASITNASKGNMAYGNNFKVLIRCTKPRQAVRIYVTNCGAESALLFNYRAQIRQFPTYFSRFTIANRFNFNLPNPIPSLLVQLDPTQACQAQLIVNAGLAYTVGLTNLSAVVTTTNTAPFTVGDSVVLFDGTTTLAATVLSIIPGVSITVSLPWPGPTESGFVIDILADWQLLADRSNTHTFAKITQDGSGRITTIIEYFCGAKVGDMARKIQYVYAGVSSTPSQITTIPWTLSSGDLVTPP